MSSLINGIIALAEEKQITEISYSIIMDDFSKIYGNNAISSDSLRKKLNLLIDNLDINIAKMSQIIAFDASYISRICSGQRKISNPESLINSICQYTVDYYPDSNYKLIIAKLLDIDLKDLSGESYFKKLTEWFFDSNDKELNSIDNFLHKLDDFDLNEYIESIHFNDLKVPTVPFQFIGSKNYYGLNEMKEAELSFFKHTVLSKKKNSIFHDFSNFLLKKVSFSENFP